MKDLKEALGGITEIRNNNTAWEIRTQNTPLIDEETQPVLALILKKIAEKTGKTIEQIQNESNY